MSLEEGSSIWNDDVAEETSAAGPSSSTRNTSKDSAAATSKKTSPTFDDLDDAGWGSSEAAKDNTDDKPRPPQERAEDDAEAESSPVDRQSEQAEVRDRAQTTAGSDAFDDFDASEGDDGGTAAEPGAVEAADGDDDFGDFGDFDDGADETAVFDDEEDPSMLAPQSMTQAQQDVAAAAPHISGASQQADWAPLRFSRDTDNDELASRIRQILDLPLADGREYPFHDAAASRLTNDRVRQVEGLAQVLVTEESRKAWTMLTARPELKPVDWMRSKTRRTYLIHMGVPINLDEVSSAGDAAKRLPPLTLKYDSKNATGLAGPRNGVAGTDSPLDRSEAGMSAKSRESSKAPELDAERAQQLANMTEDDLTLLALPALRDLQREMEQMARQASSQLTFYLQQRDTHAADAEMYNGLIRDLVSGAAKRVGGASSASSARRINTSAARLGNSSGGSGRNSPASASTGRMGSPRV